MSGNFSLCCAVNEGSSRIPCPTQPHCPNLGFISVLTSESSESAFPAAVKWPQPPKAEGDCMQASAEIPRLTSHPRLLSPTTQPTSENSLRYHSSAIINRSPHRSQFVINVHKLLQRSKTDPFKISEAGKSMMSAPERIGILKMETNIT